MSVFGRVVSMFLNEQAVKALANHPTFQRFAATTYNQVQNIKTTATKLNTEQISKIDTNKLTSDAGYALGQAVFKTQQSISQAAGKVKIIVDHMDKALIKKQ